MQNKGLIRVFAILFGLVSLYQLSFTYFTNKVEDDAKEFATQQIANDVEDYSELRSLAEARYLDSIANDTVFLGASYAMAKDKELNKGLDLKGGINVILQVSVRDILEGLSNKSKDPQFIQALNAADEAQKDSQDDYIDLFLNEFNNIPKAQLASPDIFANRTLSDEVQPGTSNEEVAKVLKTKIDESIVSAFEVLRKRIDKFGVTQPNIQRLGESGRILVELPGAKDVDRITQLLQSTAQLEFWDGLRGSEYAQFIGNADNYLRSISTTKEVTETPEDTTKVDGDDLGDILEENTAEVDDAQTENTIGSLIRTPIFQSSSNIASFNPKDTAKVNGYLKNPQVRALLPADKRYTKFLWGIPNSTTGLVDLHVVKGNRDNTPELSGGVVTDAAQVYSQSGQVAVSMQMNGKGAKVWEDMTGRAYQQQSTIAIVLDNIVYSAPFSRSGAIPGGRTEITGDFSVAEGQDLSNVLRAGKLPASADIIQSEVVGPSLGQEAIDSGLMSFAIALLFVLLWMIFYYGRAGVYADIALMVNILFIFGVLAGLGAVLTLPGIAGIVLTIGISVDANVLIFERIREEIAKGKSQKDSIKDGFNNALSSILDANITTGLTGLILLVFGTGPIKGFATTLLIGILTSLFTAIFITRLFIDGYGKNGKSLAFSTPITKKWFQNVNVDFLKKRKIAYVISGIIIAVGLGSLFTQGLDQGVDFVGGRTYTVRFDKTVDANVIEQDLIAEFSSAEAKTLGADNQLKITTKYKVDETSTDVDNEIQQKLYNALQKNLPKGMTYEDFRQESENKAAGLMSYYKVSPTIADDIKQASVWAVLGSLLVVFLYILLRFRRWQFSLGAVAAVFHDVLIVLGIFSLTYKFMPFNMEIDQAFIAAILTVIGYSLNDTVVVFDRIREYFNENEQWPMSKIINSALSSTLSRTLNTSLTTLIVLLAIFIFAAPLRGFMFSLIIGVIVGTYSSLFIATPVMYDTVKKRGIDLKYKEQIEEGTEAEKLA